LWSLFNCFLMKHFKPLSLFVFIFLLNGITQAQLFEDFEQGEKSSYAAGHDDLETGKWFFDDALIGNTTLDKKNGSRSARIRNGHIAMDFDYPNGLLEVSFYAADFSSDTGGEVQVEYSVNGGSSWSDLGDPVQLTPDLTLYQVSGSIEGNVRLRFTKTAGTRINIDDVLITDYIETTDHPNLILHINDLAHVSGSTYNFGTTTGEGHARLQMRNGGEQELVLHSFDIDEPGFFLDAEMPVTLETLETVAFDLLFQSDDPGEHTASLTFYSNDPVNETFVIQLVAETLDTSMPIPISEARDLPQGTMVTVAGWVTAADQFAGPVYFQDETAGIAWFNDDIMREEWLVGAEIGDSIVVTGELGNFFNLMQIVNDTHFEVFPESNMEQEPLDITLEQLNTGHYEGFLVRISDMEFDDDGVFSGGSNYLATDLTDEGQVRIDNFTNIPGTPIPNTPVEITGLAGRFQQNHQLLPRFTEDILSLSGPVILTAPPYEYSASDNAITFQWETMEAGHSEVRYGITPELEMGKIIDEEHNTEHRITIPDLDPATVYKVQLRSAFDADTSATAVYITSTGSPAATTGEILTFFNKDVAHELATIREADQHVNLAEKLIEYIQMAEKTAEFAFYNLSGNVGEEITDEIIDAHNRGVDVRVIASGHTGSENPLITQMANDGVHAVQSIGGEQMHNKFAVFDAHHTDPAKSWVITSSWNATDEGTDNQFQNMLVIQDVALARAYQLEFNQMWGGGAGGFNASRARFGPDKKIVNPSVFWIGDESIKVELYFSPQSNTESHINRTLSQAESNIDLALNIITRRTISNTMLERNNQGVKVRGALGAISGQGNEWDYLSTWADVHHLPQGEFGLLHHKYALIDGEATTYRSRVITGSHNWSANANFSNDENTLILHSQRVVNEYFQEFAARYWQAGGEDQFDVSVPVDEITGHAAGDDFRLINYPNPVSDHTSIRFTLDREQDVTLEVYDMMGRRREIIMHQQHFAPGTHEMQFNAGDYPAGLYVLRLVVGMDSASRTFSVIP